MINPEYTQYVLKFNTLYHDTKMSEKSIDRQLGEQPTKYLDSHETGYWNNSTCFTYCPTCDEYHQFYNPNECSHCNFTIGGDA